MQGKDCLTSASAVSSAGAKVKKVCSRGTASTMSSCSLCVLGDPGSAATTCCFVGLTLPRRTPLIAAAGYLAECSRILRAADLSMLYSMWLMKAAGQPRGAKLTCDSELAFLPCAHQIRHWRLCLACDLRDRCESDSLETQESLSTRLPSKHSKTNLWPDGRAEAVMACSCLFPGSGRQGRHNHACVRNPLPLTCQYTAPICHQRQR